MNSLSDFLTNVPPALSFSLVHLAPYIAFSRALLQITSWQQSSGKACLALAVWWATCLFLHTALRSFLPFVFAAAYLLTRHYHHKPIHLLTTENTLQATVADLTIIQSLLPSISFPHISPLALLRAAVIIYLPYLILTFLVSFRVICGIAGSVVLTWRAPWAVVARATVWRSAWFRWTVYRLWAILSGQPLPPPTTSIQSSNDSDSSNPVQSLRFLFTVYENQRWWMGLDWTAALLPGERPSWCSASQHPIPPPNAFALPESTTIYLPNGKGERIKRTAVWRWEEPEWRVLVRKDGAPLSRLELPLPAVKEDSLTSSRLSKAAGLLRDSGSLGSMATSSASDNKNNIGSVDADSCLDDLNQPFNEEPLTDADGWVYGDNKWENQSNRGGMGKYTRYRRWSRIAVVFEVVEHVEAGQVGIQPDSQSPDIISIDSGQPKSPLRQRLSNASNKNVSLDSTQ